MLTDPHEFWFPEPYLDLLVAARFTGILNMNLGVELKSSEDDLPNENM